MAIKILVLKDDRLDTRSAYLKAKAYFKEKGLDVIFFQKEVSELISVSEYSRRNGFDKLTGKPAVIVNMGLDRIVIKNCEKYLRDNEYDIVIFSWDTDLLLQKLMSNEMVTSFVRENLFPNTGFIQLAINQYDIDKDNVWKKITHEIVHAICSILARKRITVKDEMDMTTDGKPFYKNDDPYAVDGNYARTIKNISPYFNLFNKVSYKYFSEKEVSTFKLKPELWEILDKAREVAGVPFNITSGFRTPEDNKRVGGKANSSHLKGLACDLKAIDNKNRYKILKGLLSVKDELFIEVAKAHIHVDVDLLIHPLNQLMIELGDD